MECNFTILQNNRKIYMSYTLEKIENKIGISIKDIDINFIIIYLKYNYINIMLSITFGLAPIFSFIYTVETPIIILGYFFPEVKNICPYLFLIIDYSFFPFHIFKWVLELYIDKFQFFSKFIFN